ncbi:unnamed protein product, partial [marine sediment metagenome]
QKTRKSREKIYLKEKRSNEKRGVKIGAVTFFTRAMNKVDAIKEASVKGTLDFKNFVSMLYRDYVATQYDIR